MRGTLYHMRIPTLLAAAIFAAAPISAATAPLSSNVARTDDGYVMGNPRAPIKLVVLSAYGCPHCRVLDATMMPSLKRDWIDTGKVSLRYVPYGMFPTDVPSLFLSECGPVGGFFSRSGRIFQMQQKITSTYGATSEEARAKISSGPPGNVPRALASLSGLTNYAQQAGVSRASYGQCLGNQQIRQIISKRQKLIEGRYKFQGTPAVWLNGRPAGTGSSWPKLETMLKSVNR